jgi:hypothetical protein
MAHLRSLGKTSTSIPRIMAKRAEIVKVIVAICCLSGGPIYSLLLFWDAGVCKVFKQGKQVFYRRCYSRRIREVMKIASTPNRVIPSAV